VPRGQGCAPEADAASSLLLPEPDQQLRTAQRPSLKPIKTSLQQKKEKL